MNVRSWGCVLLRWSSIFDAVVMRLIRKINTLILKLVRKIRNDAWVKLNLNTFNDRIYHYISRAVKSSAYDVMSCVDNCHIESDSDWFVEGWNYPTVFRTKVYLLHVHFSLRLALRPFSLGLANGLEQLPQNLCFYFVECGFLPCITLGQLLREIGEKSLYVVISIRKRYIKCNLLINDVSHVSLDVCP